VDVFLKHGVHLFQYQHIFTVPCTTSIILITQLTKHYKRLYTIQSERDNMATIRHARDAVVKHSWSYEPEQEWHLGWYCLDSRNTQNCNIHRTLTNKTYQMTRVKQIITSNLFSIWWLVVRLNMD